MKVTSTIATNIFTNEKGDPHFYDVEGWLDAFKDSPNCEWNLVATKIGHDITDPQRGYYFAVINRLIWMSLVDQGYELSEAETHQWNKSHSPALKRSIMHKSGTKLIDIQIDFATAKKDIISNYLDERIRWSAQHLNIAIPPAPQDGESFHRITKNLFELNNFRRRL